MWEEVMCAVLTPYQAGGQGVGPDLYFSSGVQWGSIFLAWCNRGAENEATKAWVGAGWWQGAAGR